MTSEVTLLIVTFNDSAELCGLSGEGGRVGNHGATLSQYVIRNIVLRKPDERDKDPRAAILRHAEEAASNPFWVTPAYNE